MEWHDRYAPHREPDRILRQMTPGDLPGALALSQSISWDTGLSDWQRVLFWSPEGCFVLEESGRGIIGTVTTTPYTTVMAWIGMMIIAPDRQRQGLGRQLMRAALDHLIARNTQRILLDASDAGRPLYRSLGFRELYKVERWKGKASTYLGPRARRMRSDDLSAVIALDTELFGLSRGHILIRLLDEAPALAWVDYTNKQIAGYLLGRPHAGGVYLGPWMAWSSDSAERLLRTALEQVQGQPVSINIPDYNGRALILAENHNLRRVSACTRMIYGDAEPVAGESLTQLGIAAMAIG